MDCPVSGRQYAWVATLRALNKQGQRSEAAIRGTKRKPSYKAVLLKELCPRDMDLAWAEVCQLQQQLGIDPRGRDAVETWIKSIHHFGSPRSSSAVDLWSNQLDGLLHLSAQRDGATSDVGNAGEKFARVACDASSAALPSPTSSTVSTLRVDSDGQESDSAWLRPDLPSAGAKDGSFYCLNIEGRQ